MASANGRADLHQVSELTIESNVIADNVRSRCGAIDNGIGSVQIGLAVEAL